MAIYIPETSSIIQGVSAILIMITGISAGIGCYRRGKRQENTYLYWAGAFQALMATFYLGTTVSFFTLIFTGSNLDTTITGWLAYTWAPLLSALSMYISFSLIKPKLIKPFTIGALISAPVYWYGLYFNSASSITAPNLAEFSPTNLILIDLELIGLVDTMTTVYLVLFVVLIVPGMLVLAKRTTGIIRKKALLQS
ncbi:MAG: hypothetical protein GY870_08340, partial [archaeon]|nr:hypothetical protein [archaeon]